MSCSSLLAPSGLYCARASPLATLRRKLSTVMIRRSARVTSTDGISMRRALLAETWHCSFEPCLTASPNMFTDS